MRNRNSSSTDDTVSMFVTCTSTCKLSCMATCTSFFLTSEVTICDSSGTDAWSPSGLKTPFKNIAM